MSDEKMMREALLPCPFCGSVNTLDGEILSERNGNNYSQSVCEDCGACGPEARLKEGEVDYGDTKAIAAWNGRASRADAVSAPISSISLQQKTPLDVAFARKHFESTYYIACESSEPADWHQAAMYAKQTFNALDAVQQSAPVTVKGLNFAKYAAFDEAGKQADAEMTAFHRFMSPTAPVAITDAEITRIFNSVVPFTYQAFARAVLAKVGAV